MCLICPRQWTLGLCLLSLLLGLTAVGAPTQPTITPPRATAGLLDLRAWDFEQHGPVNLNGEWAFYWQDFLTPAEFATTSPEPHSLIDVPRSWRGHIVDGQPLPSHGYATYRLLILLDPDTLPEPLLALSMPLFVNSAHTLYIEGNLLETIGQVGSNVETMTPGHKPYLVVFEPQDEQIEIILHIANFHSYQSGLPFLSPTIGTRTQIQSLNQLQLARDMVLVGSIFIMSLYHFGLFSLRVREKSPLYFGLHCLAVAVTSLMDSRFALLTQAIIPDWSLFLTLRFAVVPLTIISLGLFIDSLFPQEQPKWALRLIIGIGGLFFGLIMLTSTTISTRFVSVVSLYGAASYLWLLGVIIVAVYRQRDGAKICLLGYLPFVITGLNDVLFFNELIQTIPLLPLGLFIFTLSQAYLLSVRFVHTITQTELLSEELRRSEAKYRTLFADSRDVIFITQLDGRIHEINTVCEEVLGYSPDEATTLTVHDLLAEPSALNRLRHLIAQTAEVSDWAVMVRHQTGRTIACQLTLTRHRDLSGQVTGYQGIIHDMTAFKQAEATRQRVLALEDLTQNLEERLEARTEALREANETLQTEIERRQTHQQEKVELLSLAQQQSEHLRFMSNWLLDRQQSQQQLSTTLDEAIQQKIAVIRQNLSHLQQAAPLEDDPQLTTYVAETIRLLAEMELYLEQVTPSPDPISVEPDDPLAENPLLQLSSRERQVLLLIAEGKSNPEIAELLTVRLNTVHTYLKRIRRKLEIQDTPGLIEFAKSNGLMT